MDSPGVNFEIEAPDKSKGFEIEPPTPGLHSGLRLPGGIPSGTQPARESHQASISARHSGITHPINWLEDLQGDVLHGTDSTWPGKVLKKMGATGLEGGTTESTARFVGGPAIGPVDVAHGGLSFAHGAGTGDRREAIRGAGETIRGVGETAAPFLGATNPEFLPSLAVYGTGQHIIQKGAEAMGADPDTAELIGDVGTFAGPKMAKFGGRVVAKNAAPLAKTVGYGAGAYGVGKSLIHGNVEGALVSAGAVPFVSKMAEPAIRHFGQFAEKLGDSAPNPISGSVPEIAPDAAARVPIWANKGIEPGQPPVQIPQPSARPPASISSLRRRVPEDLTTSESERLAKFVKPEGATSPVPSEPAPYGKSGNKITDSKTATPRRILGPERQLKAGPSDEVPVESQVEMQPLKARTVAGQNSEVLKKAGIAGPKATLQPLDKIPEGALNPDPHYDFHNAKSGDAAIAEQLTPHPLNKLRAIAVQRGLKVSPGDTNQILAKKIADSATDAEVDSFERARTERMQPDYAPVEGKAAPVRHFGAFKEPAAVPQTVGSTAASKMDTALFQQAKQTLGPKASISEIAQEAQRLKQMMADSGFSVKK